jgi:hypothetical protein
MRCLLRRSGRKKKVAFNIKDIEFSHSVVRSIDKLIDNKATQSKTQLIGFDLRLWSAKVI